ncbi:SMI1/KNR4 family protein [Streptomyces sp. cmx-18-6]|uniref:SMI1/KNR4 family protein n=1 Tax=Streptomyces sp. cmx-18-6 TaxID=2790930 RepID=UPI00397F678A
MVDEKPSGASIHEFATWEPVLRLLWAAKAEGSPGALPAPVRVAGRVGRDSWTPSLRRRRPSPGRALQSPDMQDEFDAVERVRSALTEAGVDDVSYAAEIEPTGRTVLRVLDPGPAVEPGIGIPHPGALVLVEGALPEPWRRLPEPTPGARPAPSADPESLERTLRERLPDAIGATEQEITAAEARLGVPLPDELKALYRVTRARWADWAADHAAADRVFEVVRCELVAVDHLHLAEASARHCRWEFAAEEAVFTGPDAPVQGLVGSPGWIVFGGSGGGDQMAVDLTPGPRGHTGQIILLDHEKNIGAELVADSLTDLVLGGERDRERERERDRERDRAGRERREEPPLVARVNRASLRSVQEAAHPALEVLSIGVWDGATFSLAPVIGLPRLRTLTAHAGTLADPLEIAALTGLEFLELAPRDWRVLLDADAVPRNLSAAAITAYGDQDLLPVVDLANEILALHGRPGITRTVLEGDLGSLV